MHLGSDLTHISIPYMYKYPWSTYAEMDCLPTPHQAPGAISKGDRGSWMCADEPAPVQVFLSPKPSQGFPVLWKSLQQKYPEASAH